jgi:hypothetical protein
MLLWWSTELLSASLWVVWYFQLLWNTSQIHRILNIEAIRGKWISCYLPGTSCSSGNFEHQFVSAADSDPRSRWCLTGLTIQNDITTPGSHTGLNFAGPRKNNSTHGNEALSYNGYITAIYPLFTRFFSPKGFDEILGWEFTLKIIERFSFGSYRSNLNPHARGVDAELCQSSQTRLIIKNLLRKIVYNLAGKIFV